MEYPSTFEEALKQGWQPSQYGSYFHVTNPGVGEQSTLQIALRHDKQDFGASPYYLPAPRWLHDLVREHRLGEKQKIQNQLRDLLGLNR